MRNLTFPFPSNLGRLLLVRSQPISGHEDAAGPLFPKSPKDGRRGKGLKKGATKGWMT